MQGYLLVSYNTSWANDCSNNQLHPGLSESASIVAKANHMGKIQNVNGGKVFVNTETPTLDGLRMALADTATSYIQSKMANGADFIAMIEQTIHVPPTSHANYDRFGIDKLRGEPANKQDLGAQNNDFGILRRIKMLQMNDASVENIKDGYNIVYDMVVNHTLDYGGEGIGIAFHNRLMDSILSWNQLEHPVVQLLNSGTLLKKKKNANDPNEKITENVIGRSNPTVHYYSDDLGQVLCFDESNKQIYFNAGGVAADLGRPIIMTAGIKGTTTLNVLVSAHGPNIFNLKFDAGNGQKLQIKDVVDNKEYKGKVDELFETVRTSIGRFINAGLRSVSDSLSQIETVNVFFGGDMNDPRGQLLESMIDKNNGLKIEIGDKTFDVKFNYDLGPRTIPKDGNDSQYGYPDILSCCANADSIKQNVAQPFKSRNLQVKAIGPIAPTRIDGYPEDFFKPENFGYNGDYALFGSNVAYPPYVLRLDNAPQQEYEENGVKVIASDHLPVTSEPAAGRQPETRGGRNRRRTVKRRTKRTCRRRKQRCRRTMRK